jgi:thioredoxin-related protein
VYWNRKLKKEVSRRKEAEEQLQESFEEISLQKLSNPQVSFKDKSVNIQEFLETQDVLFYV